MTQVIRLEPLTPEAFASFGDVVEVLAPGERVSLDQTIGGKDGAATARLSFNNVPPVALPLAATEMERHDHSSQCFVPLDVSRWVVVVAPDKGGAPDTEALRAFMVRGDQAVNYHLGTWHHPLRVLDRPGRFAVLMWTTGQKADDEVWSTLPAPVGIEI